MSSAATTSITPPAILIVSFGIFTAATPQRGLGWLPCDANSLFGAFFILCKMALVQGDCTIGSVSGVPVQRGFTTRPVVCRWRYVTSP
jgi:hypothetical protein